MTFSFKRAAAAAMAIVCAASVCGCTYDTGIMGTVDGVEIRNGIYLNYMMTAYRNGYTDISEVKEEQGDTSDITDIFTQTIDGMNANDWIKQDTMNNIKRYVAIQKLFESKGLTLTNEEIVNISSKMNDQWDATEIDYYGIGYMMPVSNIYGTNTMSEYYESIGIGLETLKDVETNKVMEEKLFMALYDTNGETPVSDADYNAYLKDNYAVVKYMELPFTDKYGLSLKEEADIQAVKDTAQSYADRISGGESYFDVRYDYDLKNAQDEAAVAAEDSFEEQTAETYTEADINAAIEKAVAEATAEKYTEERDVESAISKDYSSLNEELTEYIWNAASDSKATLFETEKAVYVVVKDDITTKESWRNEFRETILRGIKSDEFEELIKTTYASYAVDIDENLIKKYSPDTYKGFAEAKK